MQRSGAISVQQKSYVSNSYSVEAAVRASIFFDVSFLARQLLADKAIECTSDLHQRRKDQKQLKVEGAVTVDAEHKRSHLARISIQKPEHHDDYRNSGEISTLWLIYL